MITIPVPRTNTRGRGEYPQASEKTIVKELGKLAPYRNPMMSAKAKGCLTVRLTSRTDTKVGLSDPAVPSAVRELGLERRETVWSLSVVGVGNLRRSAPMVIPVPIPNTEVKHYRGENTLYGEDSSLPVLLKTIIVIGFDKNSEEGFQYIIDPKTGILTEMKASPYAIQVFSCLPKVVKLLADNGLNVIFDECNFVKKNKTEFLINDYKTLFFNHKFLMVGVKCDLATMEQREKLRGDRVIGMAKIFYQAEKSFHYPYDLLSGLEQTPSKRLVRSSILFMGAKITKKNNSDGQLLVIPNKERFGKEFEKFAPIGTLAEINLDISAEVDPELVINSLKEIKLKGLKREIDEKVMDELTEKFVRHLPSILEKSKLSSVEKLPYMTMMRGNIGNLIDFIAQNSHEIGQAIERKLRNRGGHGGSEISKYLERLEKNPYPNYVKKIVHDEIERYGSMPSGHSEAVRRRLEEKYYGFPEGKGKIIEYLVDLQKSREPLSKILCLAGPPGVGKTFFAICVAEAIGRKRVIIPLGGMNDISEILGHRRTYIGAMPGRIVQSLKRLQVNNPLIIFDEGDKVPQDSYRGNISYALLAVTDPNQNKNFIDNYLGEEVPFDLSRTMFIFTVNSVDDLPPALRDRMEIIYLSSYTEMEKLHIEDQAILNLIRNYTQESGVRELARKIQAIFQKFNVQVAEKKITSLKVTPEILSQKQYLVNLVSGEGKLGKLTGSLGKVMKESVEVAFSYVQSFLEDSKENFEKELSLLEGRDVNIHAPEGAVEKEGPSAGVALTTAILSALTNQKVSSDIGMTGEITSKGKILKIGGLKEKAIAAHRSELKTIIIPKANEKDIEDIPLEVRQNLKIVLVEEYEEV
nr:5885_t:CDS:10 [Entrophospora candida]